MTTNDTHSTFLAALKDRSNEQAWRTFDQLYRPMLVHYALSRGLTQDDAEDVTQQCVQVVVEQIGDYEHSGRFKTWLHTIIERKICDVFRRRRELQGDSSFWDRQPEEHPHLEETWDRQWWTAHLRHCAATVRHDIAESTYAAFVAFAIEEQPASVVAQRLGLNVNQVYVAKHRVLERIRGLLLELTGSDSVGTGP
jgi:RNA polymerase sigma factor (sigma-70 family)